MKIASALVLSALLVGRLAGCSGRGDYSATVSVTRANIAATAAKALENEIGAKTPPPFDCGKGRVDLKVGKTIDCTVTDTTYKQTFDAVVTITKLTGTKYSLHVQVAKTPNP